MYIHGTSVIPRKEVKFHCASLVQCFSRELHISMESENVLDDLPQAVGVNKYILRFLSVCCALIS